MKNKQLLLTLAIISLGLITLPKFALAGIIQTSAANINSRIRQNNQANIGNGMSLRPITCYDSDGGSNIYVKGKTSILQNILHKTLETKTDACVNQTTVTENYCVGYTQIGKQNFNCGAKSLCLNDACLAVPVISAGLNPAVLDATQNNPNGPSGVINIKIASFVVSSALKTAGVGETVLISQITLRDRAPGVCIGSYLKQLKLVDQKGGLLSNTINPLNVCANKNAYTFKLNQPLPLSAKSQVIIDVYADTIAPLPEPTALVELDSFKAIGQLTLSDFSLTNQNLALQKQYVEANLLTAANLPAAVPLKIVVGQNNALLGKFELKTVSGEDVDVTQIIVTDNMTGLNAAYGDVKNLTMSFEGVPAAPNSITVANNGKTITFNLPAPLTISKNSIAIITLKGDVAAKSAIGEEYHSFYIADADKQIIAVGKNTGNTLTYPQEIKILGEDQPMLIVNNGNFMASVNVNTPLANNYLMGQTDQIIAKFNLSASNTEAINISQLVLAADLKAGATGTINNIRLWDMVNNKQIGPAVASLNNSVAGVSYATSTYSFATFTGLNLQILAGGTVLIGIKVDFTDFQNGGFLTTGQSFALGFLGHLTVNGNLLKPFTATGASSGSAITGVVSRDNSAYGAQTAANYYFGDIGAYVPTSTVYRAKLTVAWAVDTPSGMASANSAMPLAKIVVTNLQNAGNYSAKVTNLNFNFNSSISQAKGINASRALTLYKDSYNGSQLATTNFASTQKFVGATAITDPNFTDVEIFAGQPIIFYATLDTSDASAMMHDTLAVRIINGGIIWTDGISTNLTAMGGVFGNADLPLVYKIMSF